MNYPNIWISAKELGKTTVEQVDDKNDFSCGASNSPHMFGKRRKLEIRGRPYRPQHC